MSDIFEIKAYARSDKGKGASRRLRHTGRVPGVVYGAHKDPEMISMDHNELIQHLDHEAFYSHILELNVDGSSQKVILKDLQRHPAKPFVTHVDFLRVIASEKIKTHVPLHIAGESKARGVKHGGVVSHHIGDVEVSCLPKDLPAFIEVDVTNMEIGDVILMSGIILPQGVELPALAAGSEYDLPVVTLHSGYTAADVGEPVEGAEGAEETESGEE